MRTNLRPDTPETPDNIERNFDMIERSSRGKRNGPKIVCAISGPNPITLMEVGLMPRIVPEPTDNPADELRKHAIGYLELTKTQGEAFTRNRAYYAELGRRYGLTNQDIGDVLGITEARVRQILAGA